MIAARYARILIAILGLLALATSASAECAWIVWVGTDGARGERVWSLVKSVAKTEVSGVDMGWAACDKYVSDTVMPMLQKQLGLKSPWPLCLPDTVDPRGAKGK